MGTSLVEFVLKDGVLEGAGRRFRAAFGRGGVVAAGQKREGDGATPAGLLRLLRVLYRADRVAAPDCAVPVEPISPQDGWCDDVARPEYNQPVRLPFAGSHESLWRADHQYDITGVLDWNFAPVLPERGSAIFFHIALPDFSPTAGCVALALPDIRAALKAGLTAIKVQN